MNVFVGILMPRSQLTNPLQHPLAIGLAGLVLVLGSVAVLRYSSHFLVQFVGVSCGCLSS